MKKLLLIVSALVLGIALAAMAQPGMCDNSRRHDGPGKGWNGCCNDGPGRGAGNVCGKHGMPGHGGRMGMGDGPGFQRILAMADKLELTDAQQEKLKQMHEKFQVERIDQRASLQKAEVKLRGLMHDDKAATTDINRAIDQVSALKGDMAKMRVRHQAEMRAVLTEKQQQMLKETRMERRKEVRVRVFEGDDDLDEIEKEIEVTPGPGGNR